MDKDTYQARHGDVMIVATDLAITADAKRIESGVLAYGEVTGHRHRIEELDNAELFQMPDGVMLMRVIAPTRIVHEEHAPIPVAPGVYRVYGQREYHPQAIRRVID